jgi:hypothetical protein
MQAAFSQLAQLQFASNDSPTVSVATQTSKILAEHRHGSCPKAGQR